MVLRDPQHGGAGGMAVESGAEEAPRAIPGPGFVDAAMANEPEHLVPVVALVVADRNGVGTQNAPGCCQPLPEGRGTRVLLLLRPCGHLRGRCARNAISWTSS